LAETTMIRLKNRLVIKMRYVFIVIPFWRYGSASTANILLDCKTP
jgi:hypothetical protein